MMSGCCRVLTDLSSPRSGFNQKQWHRFRPFTPFLYIASIKGILWRIYLQNQIAIIWAASSEFDTYRLCEQRRFRRACASAQSRQNLRCSLIQAVSEEEPSDRKPDPWLRWMAGHAQLKFVMTECSKTQIRLAGLIYQKIDYVTFYSWCKSNQKVIISISLVHWNLPFSSRGRRN